MQLMIDAHLDLAMNQIYYERDITGSLEEINARESHLTDTKFRGRATVSLPEMRTHGIGVCMATLLARSGPRHERQDTYLRTDLDFASQTGAYTNCHAQLSYYHLLETQGEIRLLQTREDLEDHWTAWSGASDHSELPIGVILSMEGADPILSPDQLDYWWGIGLRAIGPAHYGHSHYAAGTRTPGPLTDAGRALLDGMQQLGMPLDVTHLSDDSMDEAFERFEGTFWASHHNCRSLVNWDRQLTDGQIKKLVERDAVIGTAFDAIMLYDGWKYGETSPDVLDLTSAVDHIDHICQLAGSSRHCGIGTDLDGGFGTEQTPKDLKTIGDVHRLRAILSSRGYSDDDIEDIFWRNWLRILSKGLPES